MSIITNCVDLCVESYNDSCPDGFKEVGDLRYGVRVIDGTTYIVFRGTDNIKNWLKNARVFPGLSCNGHIAHKGFVRAFQKLCAGGLPTSKGANIVATGHSLGGALATLLAEHIGCKLVTFGSPKVYFRFSPAPDLDHIRVTCDDDPVPMVPGIMYSHRSYDYELKDGDHQLIDFEDHGITVYRDRWYTNINTFKGDINENNRINL